VVSKSEMSVRELFDSLLHRGFKPTYKHEPRYEFSKSPNQVDPYFDDVNFMKYDQKKAKEILLGNIITQSVKDQYNSIVPAMYQINEMLTWDAFIEKFTDVAHKRSVLTKYNDVSDEYIVMITEREKLWSKGRNGDQLTNSAEQSAYKLNDDAAGPVKVSPIDFSKDDYMVSYLISLLQCIILSKSIKEGLIEVEDRYTALGYLLGFGSGGYRASMVFDKPSIFYQPRRAIQYDVLKQFDHIFQTVDTLSYTLIFSQIIVPLIVCYLYFIVGKNIFQTQGIHAQFLLLVVEFKIIQESMLALKYVFRYNISLDLCHFIRTLAGEMHDCKMELYWFLIPGLTTSILFIAYLLNLCVYALKMYRRSDCVSRVDGFVRVRTLSNVV
jgi:hypothetical protein